MTCERITLWIKHAQTRSAVENCSEIGVRTSFFKIWWFMVTMKSRQLAAFRAAHIAERQHLVQQEPELFTPDWCAKY